MSELMAPTSLKPFAAGLAATLSLVGGAIVAGQVAGDMFGAGSNPATAGDAGASALSIPDGARPPAVLRSFAQPIRGVAVSVTARPRRRPTRTAQPDAARATGSQPA